MLLRITAIVVIACCFSCSDSTSVKVSQDSIPASTMTSPDTAVLQRDATNGAVVTPIDTVNAHSKDTLRR